jgi:hypothetical protein
VAEPIRSHARPIIARGTERCPHTCQAMERPDSGHDMGGVGASPSPGFQPATGLKPGEQDIEEPLLHSPRHQAWPKLGEDRGVKARIGELHPQGLRPVETTAPGVRRVTIGHVGSQRQVTHARRHGAAAGGPRGGERAPKAASSEIVPH